MLLKERLAFPEPGLALATQSAWRLPPMHQLRQQPAALLNAQYADLDSYAPMHPRREADIGRRSDNAGSLIK